MLRGSSEETLSEHDEELENSSLSEKEKLFSEDSSPARAMNELNDDLAFIEDESSLREPTFRELEEVKGDSVFNRDTSYEGLVEQELYTAAEKLNLETLSPRQVRVAAIIWLVCTLLSTLNLILTCMIIYDWRNELNREAENEIDDFGAGFYDFYVLFHVVGNTFAFLILLFLLISFPFRIVRLMLQKVVPYSEQIMIAVLLVVVHVAPGTNVYSLYCNWVAAFDYFQSEPIFNSSVINLEINFYYRSIECLASTGRSYWVYNAITTVLVTALIGLFQSLVSKLFVKRSEHALMKDLDLSCRDLCSIVCKGLYAGGTIWLFFIYALYIILSILFVGTIGYLPSAVPIVQVVSVIKVCVQPTSLCKPGSETFKRAIAQSMQAIFEMYLFIFLSRRIFKESLTRLRKLPYAKYRAKHLGFQLFQTITVLSALTAFLFSAIFVIAFPYEHWVCGSFVRCLIEPITAENSSALETTGINSLDPAFLSIYLILVYWLFFLSKGFLPANSHGLKGWFAETPIARSADDRPVQYVLRESIVQMETNGYESSLEKNRFALETTICLFNVANSIYKWKRNAPFEQNCGHIKGNLSVSRYIYNQKTDTRALICYNTRKIVITFQGTVSSKNVRTDTDFRMVVFPVADSLLCGMNNPIREIVVDLGLKPKLNKSVLVHSGFYKAFSSIKAELINCVTQLLAKYPESPIYLTGHSLGAGLAVLSALQLRLETIRSTKIQVITFGCPKIGNKHFRLLYDKLLPETFRIVNMRDIIPALRNFVGCCSPSFNHVGIEIALDYRRGLMVLSPNFIERLILLRFRKYEKSSHFMTYYGLALMTWIAKAHPKSEFEPDWWHDVCQKVVQNCSGVIETLDEDIKQSVKDQVYQAGVYFHGKKGKTLYRDMETQTSDLNVCERCQNKIDISKYERSASMP